MQEQPKCYRCGREPLQQLASGGYWCSWCGQAFDPKDEVRYRKAESERKQEEGRVFDRPTFTCKSCGRIVQPTAGAGVSGRFGRGGRGVDTEAIK